VCYDVATNEPKVARLLESKFTAETEPESEETPTAEVEDLSSCLVDPGDYSYGYADIQRHDCTDPARCTGCGGTFYVQNDSDQVINLFHHYYQDYSTPNSDAWTVGYQPLQPGERWEQSVSISNRWKQGITYRSSVVQILLTQNRRDCTVFTEAQMNTYAIRIDPLPCE